MSTIINTTHGMLSGLAKDGYTAYLGVPYAKPPVGDLRWKAPQPMEPWEGTLAADHFPNMAMQELSAKDNPWTAIYQKEFYDDPEYIPPMSEDCLYMNIYVPDHKEGAKLPIAFWIHGGGFSGGYCSEIEFDGAGFCKRNVIYVSVEYRLGLWGFLAHPWLDAENERGISGNYGSLDQLAALTWIYNNAEALGGDPKNITVFGQSAGAMSTHVLISSPLTKGMISKAILQSGLQCKENFLLTPTLKEAEEVGAYFTEFAGVSNIEELRALTPEQLLELRGRFDGACMEKYHTLVLVPNADGYLLPTTVKQAYEDGTMHKIPTMTGCLTSDLGTTPEDLAAGRLGLLMPEAKRWAKRMKDFGQDVYVYHFKHEIPETENTTVLPFHSTEIWYMQGTLYRSWRPMKPEDGTISETMMDMWCDFIKTGDPGHGWKAYTEENDYVQIF